MKNAHRDEIIDLLQTVRRRFRISLGRTQIGSIWIIQRAYARVHGYRCCAIRRAGCDRAKRLSRD